MELEVAGYECTGVELPSNTAEPSIDGRLFGIDDDIAAVRSAVFGRLESGQNVVVVSHSYGSIPGTAALSNLSLQARKTEGHLTGVVGVVIISGFLLPTGTTMLAVMGGHLPPQYLHESDVTLPFNGPGATHVLFDDLDRLEAEKAIWRLKPQSYGVNTSSTPDQSAGLKGVPVSYLLCSNDNAVPWAVQTRTVEAFRALGCEVDAEVAPSGHSPFLKMPKETANFIRKSAGEDIQTGLEDFAADLSS